MNSILNSLPNVKQWKKIEVAAIERTPSELNQIPLIPLAIVAQCNCVTSKILLTQISKRTCKCLPLNILFVELNVEYFL